MFKRNFVAAIGAALLCAAAPATFAQGNTFKIGLILPLTGPFASTGKQVEAGARLYMAQNGATTPGRLT
jgi:branched-chain amino acid transport system substrate-binding protein